MPKSVEITCDACGRDLTTTGNCESWRIAVVNERVPTRGGIVTLMNIEPSLDHDMYFCSLRCLKKKVEGLV